MRSTLCGLLLALSCSPPYRMPDPEPSPLDDCDGPAIHTVQGAGHRSPFEGQVVERVCGIVTSVRPGRFTAELAGLDWDDDLGTSEALAVAVANTEHLRVGQGVAFDGIVSEEQSGGGLPVTTVQATDVRVLGYRSVPGVVRIGASGRQPPTEAIASLPLSFEPRVDGIDFYESLEAMRVEVADARVVSPSSPGGAVVVPGASESGVSSSRGGPLVASGDWNPERIPIVREAVPDLSVGDRFAGPLRGIVDYVGEAFRIELDESLPSALQLPVGTERSTLRASQTCALLATYNVENLGASDAPRMEIIARQIVLSLGVPDVIALQEVRGEPGSISGTLSAERTLRRLVDAIAAQGGRYAAAEVPPERDGVDGGKPGANIRVAYLYRPERAVLVRLRRLWADEAIWSGTRKPLLADFCVAGRALRLLNVHLVSKLRDDALFGAWQPPRTPSTETRLAQTRMLATFVENELRRRSTNLVLLGDFNDFEFSSPLETLSSGGLENATKRVSAQERYSYNHEGNSELLDHLFVPAGLFGELSVDIVHLNADFPPSVRGSDHDPIVARLPLSSGPECSDM